MGRVSHAVLRRALLSASAALSSVGALMAVDACGAHNDPPGAAVAKSDAADANPLSRPDSDRDTGVPDVSADACCEATGAEPVCDGRVTQHGYGYDESQPFDPRACLVEARCTEFCFEQNDASGSTWPGLHCEPKGDAMVTCLSFWVGRPPSGFALTSRAVDTLGEFFGAAAEAETASVDAFEILADELAFHGAPRRLVRAARTAAKDERRHADAMTALALAHGAAPRAVVVKRSPPRSLEAIALENARVGCVEETFAALVAQWQAEHATDPAVAETMRTIARDEARHAALAWRIHAWTVERLPDDAVDVALQRQLGTLVDRVRGDARFVEAGAPTDREARALAGAMAATLSHAA